MCSMLKFREESDSMGKVQVSSSRRWGAQTQRSLENFSIGSEKMPKELVAALILIKKVAASLNVKKGKIDKTIGKAIEEAANLLLNSDLMLNDSVQDEFPLSVWQTGSGTQTNMNVNEVISNIAIESLGGVIGSKDPVHPNDHVNAGQSSNDSFPTAINIAVVLTSYKKLLPALIKMKEVCNAKSDVFKKIIKTGRTHMQDATPISLGAEFSGFARQVELSISRFYEGISGVFELAQGGTAVGTGLNSYEGFQSEFADAVASATGLPFKTSANKYEAISTSDAIVNFSGTLNTIAASMNKIANDIRLLASGPRCGIGELMLPANEPGSSIMPGKVNPTQCEALIMVCTRVFGNHVTVTYAGANGQLQLNANRPVMIYSILQSINLLADGINSFVSHCLEGVKPNLDRINDLLGRSLMLVTALVPLIGYDKAAAAAKFADSEGLSLRDAVLRMELLSSEEFDEKVRPDLMLSPTL